MNPFCIARTTLPLVALTAAALAHAQQPAAPDSAAAPAPTATPADVAPVAPIAPAPAPATAPAPTASASAATPPPAAAVPAPAVQTCPSCETDEDAEGSGQFLLGAGLFDWSSLNDRLAANGYERVPRVLTVIGGEGHAVLPSGFMIGGRGAAIVGPDGDGPGAFTSSFGGGFGMVDLGYAFVHTPPVLLAVLAGIGGYGVSLDISEESSVAFDDALADPERSSSLSAGGLLGALTFAFDLRVPLGPVKRGQQGFFTLGARLSGMYGPPMGDWSLSEDRTATSGPSQSLLGGVAALAVGFGGGKVLAEGATP